MQASPRTCRGKERIEVGLLLMFYVLYCKEYICIIQFHFDKMMMQARFNIDIVIAKKASLNMLARAFTINEPYTCQGSVIVIQIIIARPSYTAIRRHEA
jgi:hypothetical protein